MLKTFCFIFLFVIFVTVEFVNAENTVIVEIIAAAANKTEVIGLSFENWLGGSYYAFRGIRYAKPPVAEFRFKDPQPLSPTISTTIDARYDAHDCPSIYAKNASEDCLNLNVYSSALRPTALLPVLVFIHPGGLYLGSGLSSFISPDYLLTKSLVVVTFNYRLGTLGYLSLGNNTAIRGNAGFKDQVLVLRWIQQYIQNFGGNPNDVTLAGYSAGGLCVSQHLVSRMSAGLFHKAIIMSGALPPQIGNPVNEQRYLAMRQALKLNCSNLHAATTDAELLNCFNNYTGEQIAATLRGMFDFGKDNPIYLWLPIIEQQQRVGQQRFLHEDYYEALAAGRFHKVPTLIGYTDGEFCTSAAEILADGKLKARFIAQFDELAPTIFMYAAHNNNKHITAALKQHYLNQSDAAASTTISINKSFARRLCDLFSDAITRFGAERTARLIAPHAPVFSYKFAYRGAYSNFASCGEANSTARAEHMDDLMYIFRMAPHHFQISDKDAPIVKLYVNFIYNFIENGNVAAAVDTTMTSDTAACGYPADYALITNKIELVHGKSFDEAAFWEQLFPV